MQPQVLSSTARVRRRWDQHMLAWPLQHTGNIGRVLLNCCGVPFRADVVSPGQAGPGETGHTGYPRRGGVLCYCVHNLKTLRNH